MQQMGMQQQHGNTPTQQQQGGLLPNQQLQPQQIQQLYNPFMVQAQQAGPQMQQMLNNGVTGVSARPGGGPHGLAQQPAQQQPQQGTQLNFVPPASRPQNMLDAASRGFYPPAISSQVSSSPSSHRLPGYQRRLVFNRKTDIPSPFYLNFLFRHDSGALSLICLVTTSCLFNWSPFIFTLIFPSLTASDDEQGWSSSGLGIANPWSRTFWSNPHSLTSQRQFIVSTDTTTNERPAPTTATTAQSIVTAAQLPPAQSSWPFIFSSSSAPRYAR